MRRVIRLYEAAVRMALRHRWLTLVGCGLLLGAGILLYRNLATDFLPAMDEGGFVIDYHTPSGTSLAETSRQLLQAEEILRATPEVESYSRRTGARLALSIAEPNTGDFLVKLKPDRTRHTEDVIAELRAKFHVAVPGVEWEFPGILSDLIGDLTWSPKPIEVKLFSTDAEFLKRRAPEIEAQLKQVKGVVDVFDGLVFTGPTLSLRVRPLDAQRFGLTSGDIAAAVNTAMLGQIASSVLEGDRVVNIRVRVEGASIGEVAKLRELPLRTPEGNLVKLSQVADVVESPASSNCSAKTCGRIVAVTARLEARDLGSAMAEIRDKLSADPSLPPGMIEFGGLYQQQQESFRNLLLVLAMAILLVFTVLLIEFRSFYEPIAIVFGAVLALFGTVAALSVTGTSLNIVSFLGAIIGVGIVAKNGILMLDLVEHLRADGLEPRGIAGAVGPAPPAAGADDLARRRARHVAAGLWHRLRSGYAQAAGHRGYWCAVHLGAAFTGRNSHGLLSNAADVGKANAANSGAERLTTAFLASLNCDVHSCSRTRALSMSAKLRG